MKICAENLKINSKQSSAVIWFKYVYARDFDEDPEDLYIYFKYYC